MKVKCEKLDNLGRGIVYTNKITFVDDLLPEEEADIKIVKEKSKYNLAKVNKYYTKSKYRCEFDCDKCNCGCNLKNLSYDKQLEYKYNKVKEILNKYAKISPKINDIIYSKNTNYRNKVTLKVDKTLGYFENKTNTIIPIDRCILATDKTNKIIQTLNNMDLSKVKNIVIKDFDKTMIIVDGSIDINKLKGHVDTIYMNNKLIYGDKDIVTTILGMKFIVGKDAFFQVNRFLIDKLYSIVINYCKNNKDKELLDLYCGTGTMSILLSKYFKKVIGVEINENAIECANKNKKINNVDNVFFIKADASQINNLKADIIVVDPPRNGLSKETIKNILKLNPEKIVYVSCDIMTLSRDLNILKQYYDIKEVTPVDMFPNTHHVENMVVLERIVRIYNI